MNPAPKTGLVIWAYPHPRRGSIASISRRDLRDVGFLRPERLESPGGQMTKGAWMWGCVYVGMQILLVSVLLGLRSECSSGEVVVLTVLVVLAVSWLLGAVIAVSFSDMPPRRMIWLALPFIWVVRALVDRARHSGAEVDDV